MPTAEELRTELGKRKLSTDGLKEELEERLHAAERQDLEDAKAEAKRVKTAMNSVADEYLCPITQELPIDPVMAEDSKIYERWAIEEWLGKQQRSPSTGTAMGTRLTPVTQVRNTIGHLVASGVIDGDKATAWKKKLEEEKKAKELRAEAEEGDKALEGTRAGPGLPGGSGGASVATAAAEAQRTRSSRIEMAMHDWTQLLNHANEAAQRETWQLPPEELFQRILVQINRSKRDILQDKYNQCKDPACPLQTRSVFIRVLKRIAESFMSCLLSMAAKR